METNKTSKFLVIGYMNTGSGSLTFPEDFDIDSTHDDIKDAYARAFRMNVESEVPKSVLEGDTDFLEMVRTHLGESFVYPSFDEDEDKSGMVYDVYTVDHNKK